MKPIRAALAALALLLVVPIATAQPGPGTAKPELTPELKQKVVEGATNLILKRAFVPGVDFTKWNGFLAASKDKIDAAKSEDEFASAFQEALSKFDFSHLVLYTPRATTMRETNSTVGIGIRINPVPEGVLVVGLIEGAPAAAAGIEVGDIVVEANGVKVDGPAQIAGEVGTPVKIKVKKPNGKFKEFNIIRQKFSTIRPEELIVVNKDTVVLKIPSFDRPYDADKVEALIKEANADHAKRLIVDLRGNGGGAVMNLRHFLGTVLPDDTVLGTFIRKETVQDFVKATHGNPMDLKAIAAWSPDKIHVPANSRATFKGEVAVLIDGGSGSASEMAAAALKETLNSPVAGKKSAGAVLVSLIIPIQEKYALQIPIFDYVTAKGTRLEGNGIVPDAVVEKMPPFLKKGEKDPTWAAAEALLKKQETAKAGAPH